jgi:hypothetical protein
MKWLLRAFALLDIISFIIIYPQATAQIVSFSTEEAFTLTEIFSRFLFILLWISLLFSAGFLMVLKKIGIIIYYAQLLPRLIFLTFSVGFISVVGQYVAIGGLEKIILPLIIFVEMLRVYFSYNAQKELVKS